MPEMIAQVREESRKGRKDLAGLKGEIDWELSTGLYRSSNKDLVEELEDGEAEGEYDYDDMGKALTKEQVDMLGIILAGGLGTMDRLAGAGLKDERGRRRDRLCPFCLGMRSLGRVQA